MYDIDTTRKDLVDEFMASPGGPYSAELTLLVNRLRIMPLEDRHVIVCTVRGAEWVLAKVPPTRGNEVEMLGDQKYDDYYEAVKEVFRRRWHTVTGQSLS
ncbi:MAG: hypothetical protein CMO26_03075 [Thiotrichales bacterium]|nr:hypothetical protein [Thiotrichales bacterium]|tara:strand:- start:175 stop:474 length:300 start_codon:yes stop_codon:yes gene_type:complete